MRAERAFFSCSAASWALTLAVSLASRSRCCDLSEAMVASCFLMIDWRSLNSDLAARSSSLSADSWDEPDSLAVSHYNNVTSERHSRLALLQLQAFLHLRDSQLGSFLCSLRGLLFLANFALERLDHSL